MNTITKSDFLTMVRLQNLEVLTQLQLSQNTKTIHSYLEKSLTDELSEIEKSDANLLIGDIASYVQWEVLRDDFSKAIVYTRKEQVEWEEPVRGEFGEIIKSKGGVYKPTAENKKLGRVGQKYGEKKGSSFEHNKTYKHSTLPGNHKYNASTNEFTHTHEGRSWTGEGGKEYREGIMKESDKGSEKVVNVDTKKFINNLLSISEVQDGAFIGAFSLCRDYSDWKKETIANYEGNPKELKQGFQHFEENVKGQIMSEQDFLTDREADRGLMIDDKFDMETPYPISRLKNVMSGSFEKIPKDSKYFMILPVDYNRGGNDIGVVWLTKEGKETYSKHLSGDY